MKRLLLSVLLCCSAVVLKAERVVFAPQWTPQSQFAGYYVAQEKGFFKEEGLDVVFIHRSLHSSENNTELLMQGDVHIAGMQLLQTMLAREQQGLPLVSVMQLTQVSGLCCVAQQSISSPLQLNGLNVGRWASGFSEFCDMLERADSIHIHWIPCTSGNNLFLFGAVDATLCYNFSELISLELATGPIPADQILAFSDFGYRCPEDGLTVTEAYLRSHPDAVAAFVRASRRGWDYTREHRQEALDITWKYITEAHITTNQEKERRMLDTYLQLQVNPATGRADYAPVSRAIFREMNEGLLKTGSIPDSVPYPSMIR